MSEVDEAVSQEFIDSVATTVRAIVDDELSSRHAHKVVLRRSPVDLVTHADLSIEQLLSFHLAALWPGSTVIGEECARRQPRVLERLAERDPFWVVDPIDGTNSFVADGDRYSTLVTLCIGRAAVTSWTYVPATATLMTATDSTCRIDGVPVRPLPSGETSRRVVITHPAFWTKGDARIDELVRARYDVHYCDGVGVEYLDLARSRTAGAVLNWSNPWDHLAGVLAVAGAGGANATGNLRRFTPAGPNRLPLFVGSCSGVDNLVGLVRGAIPDSDLPQLEGQPVDD